MPRVTDPEEGKRYRFHVKPESKEPYWITGVITAMSNNTIVVAYTDKRGKSRHMVLRRSRVEVHGE